MRTLMSTALCATALVSCVSTGALTGRLQRASARAITPTPYPDSVAVSNVRRDTLGNPFSWVATTRGGVYDCSVQGEERAPLCARRDSPR